MEMVLVYTGGLTYLGPLGYDISMDTQVFFPGRASDVCRGLRL